MNTTPRTLHFEREYEGVGEPQADVLPGRWVGCILNQTQTTSAEKLNKEPNCLRINTKPNSDAVTPPSATPRPLRDTSPQKRPTTTSETSF